MNEETNFHEYEELEGDMAYPVGQSVSKNLPKIEKMANVLIGMYLNDRVHLTVRGSSGAIIGAIVSQALTKAGVENQIDVVKKPGVESHCSSIAVRSYSQRSVIVIIDDFIASGNTVNTIADEVMSLDAFEREGKTEIDCLIVSGTVYVNTLDFPVSNIVSGIIQE